MNTAAEGSGVIRDAGPKPAVGAGAAYGNLVDDNAGGMRGGPYQPADSVCPRET